MSPLFYGFSITYILLLSNDEHEQICICVYQPIRERLFINLY